jgi:lipopolysaccharide biosynthesis glycosyltransferase
LADSWSDLDLATAWYDMEAFLGPVALQPTYGHYFRVYVGSLLPSSVDRLLYLDYDTLIGRDVTELWEIAMADKVAAVVWDACDPFFDYERKLRVSAASIGMERLANVGYFNAGVMLINLALWRQREIESKVMALVHNHPGWSNFVIQDELNLVLQESLVPLSPCWNLLETIALYERWDFDLYAGLGDPGHYFQSAIIHFAGAHKPYHALVKSSSKAAFYEILDQTGWQGWRSDNDRSWWGRRLANLLELHWIVCRGFKLRSLPDPARHAWRLCQADPSVLVAYPGIFLWRWLRRLRALIGSMERRLGR